MKSQSFIARGNFLSLFKSPQKLKKYLACIFIGVPIWYVIGILITFAPEFAKELRVDGIITGSKAIMWSYVGLSLGDLSSGLLSQYLKSRKKSVMFFLSLMFLLFCIYVRQYGWTTSQFYILCFGLGFSAGFWAIFVTVAAEQFGTNLRATVATSVPNFVRGSVVPTTLAFQYLSVSLGMIPGVLIVGLIVFVLACISLWGMHETFGKDLDYVE